MKVYESFTDEGTVIFNGLKLPQPFFACFFPETIAEPATLFYTFTPYSNPGGFTELEVRNYAYVKSIICLNLGEIFGENEIIEFVEENS